MVDSWDFLKAGRVDSWKDFLLMAALREYWMEDSVVLKLDLISVG